MDQPVHILGLHEFNWKTEPKGRKINVAGNRE